MHLQDGILTKQCTEAFDGIMPADNIILYAKWEVGKVNYTVEHLIEKLDGNGYELYDRNVYTADTDSEVTPEVKYMEGFTLPEVQTLPLLMEKVQLL